MTTITEQSRNSDGRFAKSTPEPDATSAAASNSTQDHAQASGTVDQDYAAIWKGIQDRTTDAPASPDSPVSSPEVPAPVDATAQEVTPAPVKTDARAAEPAASTKDETPATPAEPVGFALADYDGSISASERALLKSVKFLPPASQWQAMSEEDRLNLLDGARSLRNHSNRQYNQRNNPAAGQPPTQIQQQPQRQAPAAVAGSFGQTPPAGQAAVSQLPPDVAQHLQQVGAEFGEDSSIYRSQLAMAQRYEEQLQRLQQTTSQFEQQQHAQRQDQAARSVEDSAAEKLSAKFPQLSDPVKRDKAREAGRQWLAMLAEQGRVDINDPTLPQKVMEFGAAFHFSQENQQSNQQTREAARTRSLSNTFDRERPKPAVKSAPKNDDDAMAEIFKGIQAAHSEGKSGQDAVRKALQAVG